MVGVRAAQWVGQWVDAWAAKRAVATACLTAVPWVAWKAGPMAGVRVEHWAVPRAAWRGVK